MISIPTPPIDTFFFQFGTESTLYSPLETVVEKLRWDVPVQVQGFDDQRLLVAQVGQLLDDVVDAFVLESFPDYLEDRVGVGAGRQQPRRSFHQRYQHPADTAFQLKPTTDCSFTHKVCTSTKYCPPRSTVYCFQRS